jgi:sortase A
MAMRTASPSAAANTGRRWRNIRRFSNGLIAIGIAILLYTGVIVAWGDPVTWVWAQYQQHQLAGELSKLEKRYQQRPTPGGDTAARALLAKEAGDFRAQAREGHALGKLIIGRIGLNVIVVQGTSTDPLKRGPGHYEETPLPGEPGTVGIAGHRTTFGAWFRHIDSIGDGDILELKMPYGDFKYRVQYHRIVDWQGTRASIVKDVGYPRLILSACHPLFRADKRWIVFARGVSVTMPDGRTHKL